MKSTKKKWKSEYAIMFASAFSLVALSIPMVYKSTTHHLTKAESDDPVSYMAWDEESKTVTEVSGGCKNYTTVTEDLTDWSEDWYVVDNNVTLLSRVNITGEVNLILCDGVELEAKEGIGGTASSSINIYAQSTGNNAGKLTATGDAFVAGIGSDDENDFGNITIHGGKINATDDSSGAGIGSGYETGCGDITIYGGEIEASSGTFGAGIGSGEEATCGDITIYGGEIEASNAGFGAGIGSGQKATCGAISIYGGDISTYSEQHGPGIGSGYDNSTCGAITINGGTITATAGQYAGAGIGSAEDSTCGTITINGGTITATGREYGAGIGSSYGSTCGAITINGGAITATGGSHAAGIGTGYNGKVDNITISNQVSWLEVEKGYDSPDCIGKGDGDKSTCGSVTICGASGTITESPYTAPRITYALNEGEEIKDVNVPRIYKEGQSVALPTNVVKEGFIFYGWYEDYLYNGDKVTEISKEDTGDKYYVTGWIENSVYEFANRINALPDLDKLTLDNQEEVYALWDEYWALSSNQQTQLSLLDEEALWKISTSMSQVDSLAAESVTNDINALPELQNITLEDKNDINAAKAAYDALNENQKELIKTETVTKLENALDRITYLENGGDVIDQINALPEVSDITMADKDKILAAKEAYDALSPEKKANIPAETVTKLENALNRIDELENGDTVIEDVEALPEVKNITLEDKDDVLAVKAAYDALAPEQKAEIPAETVDKLLEAVNVIDTLVAEDATKDIEALPEKGKVTIEDKDEIEAVIAKYESLTEEQKEKLSPETIEKIEAVKKELNDAVVANNVVEVINALPKVENITLDDKDEIIVAKEAYDALTSEQKAKVNPEVVKTLEAASKEIDDIVIAKDVEDVINSLPYVDSITTNDKEVIEAATAKYEALSEEQKAKVDQVVVDKLNAAKAKLDTAFAEEVAKDIEALPDAKDITLDDKEAIEAVLDTYNELTEEQKEKLSPETITKIEEVTNAFDTIVAVDVTNDINELPSVNDIDLDDKKTIDNIIEKYESLSEKQKEKLPDEVVEKYNEAIQEFETLENAYETITELKNASEITSEDSESVSRAKEIYDSLTPAQQQKLPTETVSKLEEAVHAVDVVVANEAETLVDNLGNITIEDEETIQAARAAYEALTDEQKEMFPAETLELLENCEKAFDTISKINDIGEIDNSEAAKEAIEQAKTAYDALTDEQKALLDEDYVETLSNSVAVQEAIDVINEIGGTIKYDADSKEAIEAAREAYEALSDEQKEMFPAETLKDIENSEKVYDVLEKIYNIGDVDYDTASEEKINAAVAAYEALTPEQKAMVDKEAVSKLKNSQQSYQSKRDAGNAVSISLLAVSSLALVGGSILLFFLLKGFKKGKGVKVNSFGLGLSTLIVLASHYADAQFIVAYIIAALAVMVWIAVLVVFLKKKQMKKAADTNNTALNNGVSEENLSANPVVANESPANLVPPLQLNNSEDEEEVVTVKDEKGNIFQIRFVKSFTAKLIQTEEETKKYYEELKNEVLSYKKTTSRISWHFDSINSGRNQVLKFAIRGKTLCVYLSLNADDYADSKYKVEKVESKKFEDVPCLYRIKNDRRCEYAKELIKVIMDRLGLEKGEEQHENYSNLPYEENAPLIKRGLIKELKVQVNKPVEESAILETKVTSDGDEVVTTKDSKGNIFEIRYIKSFIAKLSQSDDEVKNYYNLLKNYALSYKKTTSRISWHFDSINSGRNQVIKFAIRGKTLCLYYALNADDYADSKYKVEKVESKKFEDVPCLYRIKNDRRCEYAKELIDIVMNNISIEKGNDSNEDFSVPFESTQDLLKKGLIKEVKTKVEAKEEPINSITVEEADKLMSDEKAEESIVIHKVNNHKKGKKGIINVDTLSDNYLDGEEVTLDSLIEKGLISSNVAYVKLLARGSLNKKLIADLDDYSLQAVKMIVLLGGEVKKIN